MPAGFREIMNLWRLCVVTVQIDRKKFIRLVGNDRARWFKTGGLRVAVSPPG
jgi:hypothetical protein